MVAHTRTGMIAALALLSTLIAACAPGEPALAPNATDEAKRAEIDAMYNEYHEDFPGVQDISAEELAKRRETEDVIIVDTREPEEQAVSMLPGAITRKEFEARKDELKDKPIVVHCTIGYRSGVYAKELAREGIQAKNLAGSILSWAHAGQPLHDPEGNETKRVHVYGKKWNLLPEGYEPVW